MEDNSKKTMSETPVISLRNISFSYGSAPVLTNANLLIQHGDFNYIVGPNGGGKSTLLKLILGLIQPDSGEILVFGKAPRYARARIGYTPQQIQFDPQFPITVGEVVLMGRLKGRWGGWFSRSDFQAAESALDEMEMSEYKDIPFSELSGGQRQRVLIARSLAVSPELLLLDEPTANLDAETEDKLLDIIHYLNRRMTILLVSHNLGFVYGSVQSVICVNKHIAVHPTTGVTKDSMIERFGDNVRIIHHDESCSLTDEKE